MSSTLVARRSSLGADPAVDELGVHALGLEAGPADLAGVVGDFEGADHEIAGLDRLDLGAIYTAEPGSASAERLQLLASWAATNDSGDASVETSPGAAPA